MMSKRLPLSSNDRRVGHKGENHPCCCGRFGRGCRRRRRCRRSRQQRRCARRAFSVQRRKPHRWKSVGLSTKDGSMMLGSTRLRAHPWRRLFPLSAFRHSGGEHRPAGDHHSSPDVVARMSVHMHTTPAVLDRRRVVQDVDALTKTTETANTARCSPSVTECGDRLATSTSSHRRAKNVPLQWVVHRSAPAQPTSQDKLGQGPEVDHLCSPAACPSRAWPPASLLTLPFFARTVKWSMSTSLLLCAPVRRPSCHLANRSERFQRTSASP